MIRKIIGRPTSVPNEPCLQTETAYSNKSLRSSTEPYIKTLCMVCQKRKTAADTHKVKTTRKVLRMLQVAKEAEDRGFYIRLNTISNPEDAFASDVIYQLSCRIYKQRETSKDEKLLMLTIMAQQKQHSKIVNHH